MEAIYRNIIIERYKDFIRRMIIADQQDYSADFIQSFRGKAMAIGLLMHELGWTSEDIIRYEVEAIHEIRGRIQ